MTLEELLEKHGFHKSTIPFEYTKRKRYKALVFKNGVSMSYYTPVQGRFLYSVTFNSYEELEKELKKNHPYE